jgi:hypothetical protein
MRFVTTDKEKDPRTEMFGECPNKTRQPQFRAEFSFQHVVKSGAQIDQPLKIAVESL